MHFSKTQLIPAAFLLALFLVKCQDGAKNAPNFTQKEAAPAVRQSKSAQNGRVSSHLFAADSNEDAAEEPFQTAVATVGKFDSLKKFIRTADLRFQVKSTIAATLEIEKIAAKNGGFTLESNLDNRNSFQKTTPISRDSAIETTIEELHSTITIRVPFQKLDTTLREIGRLSTLFNHRRVKAEDVSLNFIENELARLNAETYQAGLGEIKTGANAKLEATTRSFEARAAADRARLDDLKMGDAIRFCTVQIEVYQPLVVRQRTVANPEKMEVKPGFLFRLGNSLRGGRAILEEIVFGLLALWPIWLLIIGGYFFFKKWKKGNP